MRRAWILAGLLSVAVTLSACAGTHKVETPQPEETPPEEQTQTPEAAPSEEPVPPETVPASVSLDYASDSLLAQEDAYTLWIDDDSDYQIMAAFTASGTVRDLQYVALGFKETEDQTLAFYVADVLYTQEQLPPDRPLVVGLALMGAIPDRGLCFRDETGALQTFTISMSGRDSSLLLTPTPFSEP